MVYEPLLPPRSRSQLIVAQIEERIRTGELKRGMQFPTEAELATQFKVSRSVVREAMKLLEALGLVTSQQGRGSFVRHDPGPTVSRVLSLSVLPDEISMRELFEFRRTLEVESVRLAATRRTDADLAEIEKHLKANADAAAANDGAAFTETDWRLHSRIAEASGNRYLTVVLKAVREMQHDAVALMSDDIGSVNRATQEHGEIVECIARGSADDAEVAMCKHISSTLASIDAHSRRGQDLPPS